MPQLADISNQHLRYLLVINTNKQWRIVVKLAERAAKFHLWLQARRQDLAAGGAKNQMEGQKNRKGATFLKYSIGCMQQPGYQT